MESPTRHPRSVKRKLSETDTTAGRPHPTTGDDVAARVEVENEVSMLRETLASQQNTILELMVELDEERNAASTAASEAMSMILRLQREKAEIQMEFRQFKRFAEEKMAHDQQELVELDDIILKKEDALRNLSFEVENYRSKFGLDEFEYPHLKCMIPVENGEDDCGSSVLEKYTPNSMSVNELQNLESRIYEMETDKKELKFDDTDNANDGYDNDSGSDDNHDDVDGNIDVNDENDDYDDDNESASARVYTIDAVHAVVPNEEDKAESNVMDGGDIKKLYMRLQALEADRESMRQAIISMRTEKAQLVLLKEIAQQLCKEGVPEKKNVTVVKKPSFFAKFSFAALIKWVLSFIFWRKKASRSRYSCGITNGNVGLLLLLDKSPHMNQWQCLRGTLKSTRV